MYFDRNSFCVALSYPFPSHVCGSPTFTLLSCPVFFPRFHRYVKACDAQLCDNDLFYSLLILKLQPHSYKITQVEETAV